MTRADVDRGAVPLPMTGHAYHEIIPLDIGTFTFADDEPWAGELGVVVAYAIRRREGVLLFDTGFGFGSVELDERYHAISRPLADVLGETRVVDQAAGPVVLSGQAVYGLDEWQREPGREGASVAADRTAYDASVERLRAIDPSRVLFAHDRRPWAR